MPATIERAGRDAVKARQARRLIVTLLCLAAALAAAEILLRSRTLTKVVRAGWRSAERGVKREELNEAGFRGRPFTFERDDFVIVLVGDSHVEATACSFARMPESLLEGHLRGLGKKVRVCTLGSGGYGQDQQLLVLREYFTQHRADLVLVWFNIGNDLFDNLFPTQFPTNGWPKPTFWLENGQLRGPNWALGENVAPAHGLLDLWRRVDMPDFDGDWEKGLPPAYVPAFDPGPVEHDWQRQWDANDLGMRLENFASEKTHHATWLCPPSPRMLYARELTRVLLRAMRDLAADHAGRLALFVPSEEFPVPPQDRWETHVQTLNGKHYRTSFWQPQAHWAYVREGMDHYDVKVTEPDPWVSPTDHHFNERALDRVMRDLAARVAPGIPNGH